MKNLVALCFVVFCAALFTTVASCSAALSSGAPESINDGGGSQSSIGSPPFRLNVNILEPTMGQPADCIQNDGTRVTFSVTVTNLGSDINSNFCSPPVLKLCRSTIYGLEFQDIINQYPLRVLPADKPIPGLSSYTYWFSNVNLSESLGSYYFYLYFDCFDLNNKRLTNEAGTSGTLWRQLNYTAFTVSPFHMNFQVLPTTISLPGVCTQGDGSTVSVSVTYTNYGSIISSNYSTMPQFVLCQSSESGLTYMDFINNPYSYPGVGKTLPLQNILSNSGVTVTFDDFDVSTIVGTNYFYIFTYLNTLAPNSVLLTNSPADLDKECIQLNSTPFIVEPSN